MPELTKEQMVLNVDAAIQRLDDTEKQITTILANRARLRQIFEARKAALTAEIGGEK